MKRLFVPGFLQSLKAGQNHFPYTSPYPICPIKKQQQKAMPFSLDYILYLLPWLCGFMQTWCLVKQPPAASPSAERLRASRGPELQQSSSKDKCIHIGRIWCDLYSVMTVVMCFRWPHGGGEGLQLFLMLGKHSPKTSGTTICLHFPTWFLCRVLWPDHGSGKKQSLWGGKWPKSQDIQLVLVLSWHLCFSCCTAELNNPAFKLMSLIPLLRLKTGWVALCF